MKFLFAFTFHKQPGHIWTTLINANNQEEALEKLVVRENENLANETDEDITLTREEVLEDIVYIVIYHFHLNTTLHTITDSFGDIIPRFLNYHLIF